MSMRLYTAPKRAMCMLVFTISDETDMLAGRRHKLGARRATPNLLPVQLYVGEGQC